MFRALGHNSRGWSLSSSKKGGVFFGGGLSLCVLLFLVAPGCENSHRCSEGGNYEAQIEAEDPAVWVDEEGNFLGDCEQTCEIPGGEAEYACVVARVIPATDGEPNLGGNGGVGGEASESTAATVVVLCEIIGEYCYEQK